MVAIAPPPRGTSIFSVMTQMSNQFGAVNLAQGFPDRDGPEEIKEAAIAAIREGKNQYAPAPGLLTLRQKITARYQRLYNLGYDADSETTVYSGATEALFCGISGLFAAGDEIIALDPHYESYRDTALAFGVVYKGLSLEGPDWNVDVTRLKELISPKTRGIIINTPHNPTGRVLTHQELSEIAALADLHDLIVISDEVYEEIVFDQHKHRSLASYPGMRERTVIVSSTSKTFSMTGWKVGYALAPAALTNRMRYIHQSAVFCSATPLQWGMLPAFDLPEDYYQSLRQSYNLQRMALYDRLSAIGYKCRLPQGTYFILADYSHFSDDSDVMYCQRLVKEAGVASIPISVFYSNKDKGDSLRYIRFGFCKDIKTLDEAYNRLKSYYS